MKIQQKKISELQILSKNLRKDILDMSFSAGASSSHLGGALSIVEIISSLFGYKMKINKDPQWVDRDRFILSKGHACLAYYAALHQIGYISDKELKTFEKDDSNLLGHPVLNEKLGIDFSNGSLGMGLALGIGVAISLKKKEKKNEVFVVLGDGECNEGSVWEAAMAGSHFKLNNLSAIIDNNKFQQTGTNNLIMSSEKLEDKWKSFGWETFVIDGHNIEEICKILDFQKNTTKPKAIIANTIKGKGFTFSENNNDWHHSVLTKSLYEQGVKELNIK